MASILTSAAILGGCLLKFFVDRVKQNFILKVRNCFPANFFKATKHLTGHRNANPEVERGILRAKNNSTRGHTTTSFQSLCGHNLFVKPAC